MGREEKIGVGRKNSEVVEVIGGARVVSSGILELTKIVEGGDLF